MRFRLLKVGECDVERTKVPVLVPNRRSIVEEAVQVTRAMVKLLKEPQAPSHSWSVPLTTLPTSQPPAGTTRGPLVPAVLACFFKRKRVK